MVRWLNPLSVILLSILINTSCARLNWREATTAKGAPPTIPTTTTTTTTAPPEQTKVDVYTISYIGKGEKGYFYRNDEATELWNGTVKPTSLVITEDKNVYFGATNILGKQQGVIVKNGALTKIESERNSVYSIFVDGSTIFAAANREYHEGTYWVLNDGVAKPEAEVKLECPDMTGLGYDTIDYSFARGISKDGNSIYVVGDCHYSESLPPNETLDLAMIWYDPGQDYTNPTIPIIGIPLDTASGFFSRAMGIVIDKGANITHIVGDLNDTVSGKYSAAHWTTKLDDPTVQTTESASDATDNLNAVAVHRDALSGKIVIAGNRWDPASPSRTAVYWATNLATTRIEVPEVALVQCYSTSVFSFKDVVYLGGYCNDKTSGTTVRSNGYWTWGDGHFTKIGLTNTSTGVTTGIWATNQKTNL